MTIFGFYIPIPRWSRHAWWRWFVTFLGIGGLCAAVWFGGPLTGWGPLASVRNRIIIIAVILILTALIFFIRWRRRVRAAREIEAALIPVEPEGDGRVLAEKMQEALGVLKKSGGAASLYDLPWYIIIGPPGAGKTTALANSGLDFPVAQDHAISGFGGTRNMDFWFAEDAVLIDTAGRYTTQDSDRVADKASWDSFLELLKRTRPNRPINGVILAFSVEDMMRDSPEELSRHAEIVRARLAELHEQLKIDFPVYVMFTKADLIVGFREYFSSYSLNRRKLVWGVTFQTKDRKAITHEAVPAEFDRLVARLSDEIVDRLSEEPDGVARIAIFGLPGQMALLRDNVSSFLRKVFEPTRYKTNAILRGFYFTSGTQEGTPVDQVLGAIQSPGAPLGFQSSFMSGRGKSYFIHDLLRRVIFPEQGWVSHDLKAVRRAVALRSAALSAILIATVGLIGALGYSYWKNRQLVATAEAETKSYALAAQEELSRDVIDNPDLQPILPLLNKLATMPAGYGDAQEPSFWEGLGLGQRERLNMVATDAYAEAMERMMRPRLILDLEQGMPDIIAAGDMTNIYRALKVYLLLGKQGDTTDDDAIKAWFDEAWRRDYPGLNGLDQIDQLKGHLDAMLKLDDKRTPLVDLDQNTVDRARAAIAQLPVDEQAYALIKDGAVSRALKDWPLAQVAGNNAPQVFTTRDGKDLASLTVPGLYTYEGFWSYFYDQLSVVGDELRRDQWVLGDLAKSDEIEGRLARLDRDLLERYRVDFIAAWNGVLDNLTLTSMVADKPQYAALSAAASAQDSPLLKLVTGVAKETNLSKEYKDLEGVDLAAMQAGQTQGGDNAAASAAANSIGNQIMNRIQSRSSGVQRILMDAANQGRKAGGGGAGSTGGGGQSGGDGSNSILAPIDAISKAFENWQVIAEGDPGQRPIDTLLGNLGAVLKNLQLAEHNPDQAEAALPTLLNTLTQYNSQLPDQMSRMVSRAESDFRTGASDASIAVMNRALSDRVSFMCRDEIKSRFPFAATDRQLSIDTFTAFFGPGGVMDKYFNDYLDQYVERTPEGMIWRADKPITQRLSQNTLKQFERAERINRAFFAGGSSTPSVEITVAQVDANPTIEMANLAINGTVVQTATGSLARTVMWPGTGKSTILELHPSLNRPSTLRFEGSSWSFMELLNAASSKTQKGDVTRATFMVGGRNITFDFTISAVTNPFTMPEFREFECPQSVD